MNPKIFIAIPTSGDFVPMRHAVALAALVGKLERDGVQVRIVNIGSTNIVEQRDALAHRFLQSSATHMLLVDSDMEPKPAHAENLLAYNLPFVGTGFFSVSLERLLIRLHNPRC
jgi:hypothetical protein